MKKYLIIIISILLLTGCNKETPLTKKMECTLNKESNGIKVEGIYELTYTDNYMNNSNFTEKYTVDKDYLIETVETTFDSLYKELGELDYYDYTRNTEGLTITSNVSINYDKIDLNSLTNINKELKNAIKEDKIDAKIIINSYKKNGAICKEIN